MPQSALQRAFLAAAFGSAIANYIGVAPSHILLGIALACLIAMRGPWIKPAFWLPLAFFAAWTLVSAAASDAPLAAMPQIKKFYVFLILPVLAAAISDVARARWLTLGTISAATLTSLLGIGQFAYKAATAGPGDFYRSYVAQRITGMMSHWMTFGGLLMPALLMLAAFLFFARRDRRMILTGLASAAVIATAIVLSGTRNIWLGSAIGGLYLLWHWRKWTILATPVLLAAVVLVSPPFVKDRVVSIFQPRGEVDSNMHRVICRRVGYRMIAAHPLTGLGPERIGVHFKEYLPADVKQPLPEGFYGHLHNIYIQYAAERGIPALLAMLWMLGTILCDFIRARPNRQEPDRRFLLHGATAVVIGTLASGWYEHNLGDSEVLMEFLTVISCGYAAAFPRGSRSPAPDL